MDPHALLDAFDAAAAAVGSALVGVHGSDRRARTDRPGQYAIDLLADAAALGVLHDLPVAVVSEESGVSGDRSSPIVVVVDPVDGSSNAARDLPYWATSLCAMDAGGPLAALVVNQATGVAHRAVRGEGAFRDGVRMRASSTERVEDAVVALSGLPGLILPWKQFRVLGSAALALCDVAAGAIDGFLDVSSWHAPWDYLGGVLMCTEAGAVVADAGGRALDTADGTARRQVLAAGTAALHATLLRAAS
ncbi:MAG: inositol monophosphatase family protein [Actinomycetes bacterium]